MKVLTMLMLAVLLCASCGSSKKKEEQAAIEKEVVKNDSIALQAEQAKMELDESISEVDSLLNDL